MIPNNGYVKISEIGSNYGNALNCHFANCREDYYCYYETDWFAPNGTRVEDTEGFYVYRNYMAVMLERSTGAPPEGIYHCSVDDKSTAIYVGLYESGNGMYIAA